MGRITKCPGPISGSGKEITCQLNMSVKEMHEGLIQNWHIWISGNSSQPLMAQTLCGVIAHCIDNRDDATCKFCIDIFTKQNKEYRDQMI